MLTTTFHNHLLKKTIRFITHLFKLFVFSTIGALNYQRTAKDTSPIHACQSRNLPRHLAPTDAPSWLAHEQHVAILRRSHVNKSICWHHSWTDQLSMDHLTKRHNFWELSVVSLTTQKYFFSIRWNVNITKGFPLNYYQSDTFFDLFYQ